MEKLRDMYLSLGHDEKSLERLERTEWYLAQLSNRCALELDNHLLGRNDDFSHVNELAGLFKKYSLTDPELVADLRFPVFPVWRVMRKTSDSKKDIRTTSELALEFKLLGYELSNVPVSVKDIPGLRAFFCEISREYLHEHHRYHDNSRHRLVA